MKQSKEETNRKRREKRNTRESILKHKEQNKKRNTPERIEKLKLWARQYRIDHPERTRGSQKRVREKMKQIFPEKLMFMENKKRAKARGIPFSLQLEDIIIPEFCPITGIKLEQGQGRVHDASPSLDRLIPSLGYIKGNCYVISSKANRMKQENTLSDLKNIIDYITSRLPNLENKE